MRSVAEVLEVLDHGEARVLVKRKSACSGDCHECGGCMNVDEQIEVVAKSRIAVSVGDRVFVESPSGKILKLAFVFYLLPALLMILFYFLGSGEGSGTLLSLLGLTLGVVICMGYVKATKALGVRFFITAKAPQVGGGITPPK